MLGKRHITNVRDAFEAFAPLTESSWRLVANKLELKKFKKGEAFIHSGESSQWLGFLEKGLFRAYYLSSNGDEMTTNFCAEGSFVSAYAAAVKQEPSRVSIVALENSSVVRLNIGEFRKILVDSSEWTRIGLRMLEAYYVFQEGRIDNLLTLDATERYRAFCQMYGELECRLNQQHIASFLGVSRETLSRLKKSFVL